MNFLKEAWEILYYALWQPSALQNRVLNSSMRPEDEPRLITETSFAKLFFLPLEVKVRRQIILILFVLSSPSFLPIINGGIELKIYFLLAVCVSYSAARIFLPSVFIVPFLAIQSYGQFQEIVTAWIPFVLDMISYSKSTLELRGTLYPTGFTIIFIILVIVHSLAFKKDGDSANSFYEKTLFLSGIISILLVAVIEFYSISYFVRDIAYEAGIPVQEAGIVMIGILAAIIGIAAGAILVPCFTAASFAYICCVFAIAKIIQFIFLISGLLIFVFYLLNLNFQGFILFSILSGFLVSVTSQIWISTLIGLMISIMSYNQLGIHSAIFLPVTILSQCRPVEYLYYSFVLDKNVRYIFRIFKDVDNQLSASLDMAEIIKTNDQLKMARDPEFINRLQKKLDNLKNDFQESLKMPDSKVKEGYFSTDLKSIPPISSEILYFPLAGHHLVLSAAFLANPEDSFRTIRQVRASAFPGYRNVYKKTVSQIIIGQLQKFRSIQELMSVYKEEDSQLLFKFFPEIYTNSFIDLSSDKKEEIDGNIDLFNQFRWFSREIKNAMKGGIYLRDRMIGSILQKLDILSNQVQVKTSITSDERIKWRKVCENWSLILQRELQHQKRELSQSELLSPFQHGNPLKGQNSFKGRRLLADRLCRLILDRNRPTLVLYGTRRSGKTSFLLNLSQFLPSELIPVYLDLQSAAISSSEANFSYGIVLAIHQDTRSQNLLLPTVPSRDRFKSNPYATLEDWLDQALPQLPEGRRILLNLDEFENIGTAISDGKLSLNLLNELRHLIQHYDQLAFMFSGVQTLEELGPNWSSYFISVVPIEMGYLEPHEAEDLLRNPDPDFKMRYADGLIEEILRLTCCQPYLLQLIGSCLVTQANQTQTTIATLLLLQAAIPDAFTNGEPYFIELWTKFTGTTPTEVQAGQQMLQAIIQNQPPNLTTPEAQSAHRRLQRFHILTSSDRIEIPLFERWVKERSIDSIP
jgi:hypothetical protein